MPDEAVLATPQATPEASPATPAPSPSDVSADHTREAQETQRFAALARRERAIQKQASDLKTREQALSTRELTTAQIRQQATKDPAKALEMLGLNYNQLTEYIASGNKVTPDMASQALKQEWETFRQQQDTDKRKAAEAQQQQAQQVYDQAVDDFRVEIGDYLLTNKDEYEYIQVYEAQPIVLSVIEQHYQATAKAGKPRIMSIKEASDLVEKDLADRLMRATASKKFAAKAQTQTPEGSKTQAKNEAPPRTLSNLTPPTSSTPGKWSEKDRMARAIAALSR